LATANAINLRRRSDSVVSLVITLNTSSQRLIDAAKEEIKLHTNTASSGAGRDPYGIAKLGVRVRGPTRSGADM
jgi:hypothetical protein